SLTRRPLRELASRDPAGRQRQFPKLADQVLTKASVRLLLDQAEAGGFVDAAGGYQHVVGPQRQFAVAGAAGKPDAFGHQTAPDAETAGAGFDIEQAQLADIVG